MKSTVCTGHYIELYDPIRKKAAPIMKQPFVLVINVRVLYSFIHDRKNVFYKIRYIPIFRNTLNLDFASMSPPARWVYTGSITSLPRLNLL